MCPSPWTSPASMKIRTFQTSQLRFILPIRPDRPIGPCTSSTRGRPDWSFGQIHDQKIELTELKLVFPGQLDKLRLMLKQEST
ncbi:hypothetical protein Bca4012_097505 [Brassica carinata]|uniref:Uncharacterized protein n=2 Tax=Brassica TaxID=3705 RepID=A0A8S9LLQ1_BRACR|nr:hypothetical protein F2Q68_00042938 [Brassica cretica]KAF3524281.1 hypothetical protein F2Q69_00045913 [Brassica cretica]